MQAERGGRGSAHRSKLSIQHQIGDVSNDKELAGLLTCDDCVRKTRVGARDEDPGGPLRGRDGSGVEAGARVGRGGGERGRGVSEED